jgi:pimeloyl-ACP methyl ester carboxylesterase
MPGILEIITGAYFAVFLLALLWNGVISLIKFLYSLARNQHEGLPIDNYQPPLEPEVVITLVHGTWARSAAWTLPSSDLCKALSERARGPVRFERFIWSGRNSISARRQAVNRLVTHLHSFFDRWPKARHYLVGHSHGGNIAFQALTDPRVNNRIVGLACLSTPFLTVTPRNRGPVGKTVLWWLPIVIALVVFNVTLRWTFSTISQIFPELTDPQLLILMGTVFILALAIGYGVSHLMARLPKTALRSLKLPKIDPSRILIVRTPADEASAALGTTYIISWVSGLIWQGASRAFTGTLDTMEHWRALLVHYWVKTAFICLCLIGLGIAVLKYDPNIPAWFKHLGGLSILLLLSILATLTRGGPTAQFVVRLLLTLIALPFFMVIALLSIGIGPELVVAGLFIQVTAETTPPGEWKVCQVVTHTKHVDTNKSIVNHSASYQNESALKTLGEWFEYAEHSVD